MVLHICEKCRGEFKDSNQAVTHESIPTFGDDYNCKVAKSANKEYLIFLNSKYSPSHEAIYNSLVVENFEVELRNKFNGEYTFSQIQEKKNSNYFSQVPEETVKQIESAIIKKFGKENGKIRLFWQNTDELKSI